MARETFDRSIQRVKGEVLMLGELVEQVMLQSLEALKHRDLNEAKRIFDQDVVINETRYAIENAILTLMATQQPIARDLRLMSSLLGVTTELERMGDYAKGIAKVTLRLEDADLPIALDDFTRMAEKAVGMLDRGLQAFMDGNVEAARAIPEDDQQVDALYEKIYRALIAAMIADQEVIDEANLLMWAAHNIERLADRVTNICERVVFVATGELAEMDIMRSGDE